MKMKVLEEKVTWSRVIRQIFRAYLNGYRRLSEILSTNENLINFISLTTARQIKSLSLGFY